MKDLNFIDEHLVRAKIAIIPEIISEEDERFKKIKDELFLIGIPVGDKTRSDCLIKVMIKLEDKDSNYKPIEWLPDKILYNFLYDIEKFGKNNTGIRYFDKLTNKIIEMRLDQSIVSENDRIRNLNITMLYRLLDKVK